MSFPRPLLPALALAVATSCTHLTVPSHPRPPLPLPDALRARYALSAEVTEESLVPIGAEDGIRFYRGRLACGDELAEFHYLTPPGDGPHPFVLCLPILAGGRGLMWMVATSMAERGYAVAWTRRVTSALKPGQRGREIELLLRRTVRHNRMVLAWSRHQPEIDHERLGCLGISLGGIVGAVLLAVEPELRGGALCLAGGDLADLLMVSAEDRVARWRRWRHQADGASGVELERELRLHLLSDPALLGPYVPAEKVLLIGGTLDEVVPTRNQDLLWESLGRPERRLLPLGHYTSALGFGSILASIDGFLQRRLQDTAVAVAGGDG